MSNATTSHVEIDRAQWNAILTTITRDYRGAHATLEVIGSSIGRQVPTENRPFEGISADTKDGESTVWIAFGPPLTHGVHGVTAIRLVPTSVDMGLAVEVEASDGGRTILRLDNPQRHSLPAADDHSYTKV